MPAAGRFSGTVAVMCSDPCVSVGLSIELKLSTVIVIPVCILQLIVTALRLRRSMLLVTVQAEACAGARPSPHALWPPIRQQSYKHVPSAETSCRAACPFATFLEPCVVEWFQWFWSFVQLCFPKGPF
jgi:hypothetical protein